MAKNSVSAWSSTAAGNTDVGGINIAENMNPAGVNDAMREMMAQLKVQFDAIEPEVSTVSPVLLFITGDSRAAGTNGDVGTQGAGGSNARCFFWQSSSFSWVDDTLGQEPFDPSGNNNIARAIAHEWQERTGRDVYVVLDATAGSNIWQWLDPTASHGNGADTYWSNAVSKLSAALASAALIEAGVATVTANIVALGSNNGAADAQDFETYIGNYVTQLRALSSAPDAAVVWLESQETAGSNVSNQNQVIRGVYETRAIPDFAAVSARGLANSDGVHETSPGMEAMAPRVWAAYQSREIAPSAPAGLHQYRIVPAGTSSGAPYAIPTGHHDLTWVNYTVSDAWITADPSAWPVGARITFQNANTAGAMLYVDAGAGQIDWTDRPGFSGASEEFAPGASATYYRALTGGGVPIWRIISTSEGPQPYAEMTGDGSTLTAAANGTKLTGWAEVSRSGITYASGSFTITRPGFYQVSVSILCTGEARLVRTSGGSASTVLRARNNGAQVNISTAVKCSPGDVLHVETAQAAGADVDMNAQYARFVTFRQPISL